MNYAYNNCEAALTHPYVIEMTHAYSIPTHAQHQPDNGGDCFAPRATQVFDVTCYVCFYQSLMKHAIVLLD